MFVSFSLGKSVLGDAMDAIAGDAAEWFAGCVSSANGFEFRLEIGVGASPS